ASRARWTGRSIVTVPFAERIGGRTRSSGAKRDDGVDAMVEGLERFASHFAEYVDQYALIGGAACDLAMRAAPQSFRAHKNDVFRLMLVIDPEYAATIPAQIASDMERFATRLIREPIDLPSLGIRKMKPNEAIEQ